MRNMFHDWSFDTTSSEETSNLGRVFVRILRAFPAMIEFLLTMLVPILEMGLNKSHLMSCSEAVSSSDSMPRLRQIYTRGEFYLTSLCGD